MQSQAPGTAHHAILEVDCTVVHMRLQEGQEGRGYSAAMRITCKGKSLLPSQLNPAM